MKNLSITQQYLLCVLNKNGKLPAFGLEKTLCLSAAGVLELLMEDVFAFDGKKLTVQSTLPEEKGYRVRFMRLSKESNRLNSRRLSSISH